MRTTVTAVFVGLILTLNAQGQEKHGVTGPNTVHDYSAFTLNAFAYDRKRVRVSESSQFQGKKELTQSAGRGTCAWVKDLHFTDGTIECDMAGGAYLGISFRVIQGDESTNWMSEDVYFRVESNERPGTVQYYPHGKLKQEELHRPPYVGGSRRNTVARPHKRTPPR